MRRLFAFALLLTPAYAQTAISELSSFWEGDITQGDLILWDRKGTRHGMHVGRAAAHDPETTIFGSGWKTGTANGNAGVSVPATLVNTSGSFALAVWCRHARIAAIVNRTQSYTSLWNANFNDEANARFQWAGLIMGTGVRVTEGDLALVWMIYNSGTGQVSIAVNDSALVTGSAPEGFTNTGTQPLNFGHSQLQFGRGATIGRAMFWDGYIPTDGERSDIWNNGAGRDSDYFGISWEPPPRRITGVTLLDDTFADDSILAAQGLYWLRPYPLKFYSSSLAATHGDYIWWRSPDHSTGFAGKLLYGFSNSPETLPTSWTVARDDAGLNTDVGTSNRWNQLETPFFAWNPESGKFLLYGHAVDGNRCGIPCFQQTFVWSSENLTDWMYEGAAFPVDTMVEGTALNHTGYASVRRIAANEWVGISLGNEGTGGGDRMIRWTSTNGITWGSPTLITCPSTGCYPIGVPGGIYGDPQLNGGVWMRGYETQAAFVGISDTIVYPAHFLFSHPGTNLDNDWLQDVQTYVENGDVWLYAKWSFKEPSTVRLFKGTWTPYSDDEQNNNEQKGFWPDRRSIGALFLANGNNRSETNPRGYFPNAEADFLGAGAATAKAAQLAHVAQKLDTADTITPKPQGIIVWDLEGEEFQHSFTYVGNPPMLSILAPEMDSNSDDIFRMIRGRGYKAGLTIRPHKILSGSGRPTNGCKVQGTYDGQVYIDTSASYPNRGYRCGPGPATFDGSTVTTSGEFVANYQSGSVVRFYSTGTLPSPLVKWDDYYLCNWDNTAKTFTVASDAGCTTPVSVSGGSGTHTFMSWRGPVDLSVQALPLDAEDAYENLKAKIGYAVRRWGVEIVYIDSDFRCNNADCWTGNVTIDAATWEQLSTDFPGVLLVPEVSPATNSTGRFYSFANAQYKRHPDSLDTYPYYFVVPFINDTTPGYTDWRTDIRQEIVAGVPYILTINALPTAATAYQEDLTLANVTAGSLTLTNTATSRARTFTGTPRTAHTYPLVLRVAFRGDGSFDGSEGTYCERRDTVQCFEDGARVTDGEINLTGLSQYRVEYRTFTGRLMTVGYGGTL